MNRDRDFDQTLTRWLDDGAELAPERYVWAALEEVDRTGQRTALGALVEGFLMKFQPFAIPLAVAAVLLVAVAAVALVIRPPSVGPQPLPSLTEATQVEDRFSTSRFAVPLDLSMDAAPDPNGWFIREGESVVRIGPAASSAGQSELVIIDPSQARIVDENGVASALPDDLFAWLDAQLGISAGPQMAFDADEQESYPIEGRDVPVFLIEIDAGASGSRTLLETDEGPVLRVADTEANWWILPFESEGSELIFVITSDADGERALAGSYVAMLTSLSLR